MTSLHAYLTETKETGRSFAKRIGASEQFVSFLRQGSRRPSLAMAIKIAQATGGKVAVTSWTDDAPAKAHDALAGSP